MQHFEHISLQSHLLRDISLSLSDGEGDIGKDPHLQFIHLFNLVKAEHFFIESHKLTYTSRKHKRLNEVVVNNCKPPPSHPLLKGEKDSPLQSIYVCLIGCIVSYSSRANVMIISTDPSLDERDYPS